jgi:hypothetical protein
MEKKSEGLGDSIDKFTTKTGIKKLVKWIAGEDCGCDSRRDRMNELFKYSRNEPQCLTEDEFEWLTEYFKDTKKFSNIVVKTKIGTIYARVFGLHYKKICNCNGGRQLMRYTSELRKILALYEQKPTS